MKLLQRHSDVILCMSNVRGRYVKNPTQLPFSFYFSAQDGQHSIRVKPSFNPEKLKLSQTGTLKLCDDWQYIPGKDDKAIDHQSIQNMKQFFRDYFVLFAAVWDEQIQDATVEDYFTGRINFHTMLQDFDFYDEYEDELDQIKDIQSLEQFCRDNYLVNFYGN